MFRPAPSFFAGAWRELGLILRGGVLDAPSRLLSVTFAADLIRGPENLFSVPRLSGGTLQHPCPHQRHGWPSRWPRGGPDNGTGQANLLPAHATVPGL